MGKVFFDQMIKHERIKRGMTQKQLAEKCGMADSAIRKYESGKVTPTFKTLDRIAQGLGGTVGSIFGYWDHKPTMDEVMQWQGVPNDSRLEYFFNKLNDEGKQVAVERLAELATIPKYRKQEEEE